MLKCWASKIGTIFLVTKNGMFWYDRRDITPLKRLYRIHSYHFRGIPAVNKWVGLLEENWQDMEKTELN